MPDIRLQDYVDKIRDMIREVRLDEAIGHSQHILRHYPKHIETYCLLGEACLEKEMYRDAIESFQRALSADPESLIARVGLSVIYDEQGALPEAIWQLERAFELAPGNAEVRQELQRLYVRHGAGEQSRLKLTRGALGRLYSRNGLYERAIGEFQAVLRQDPDLPDVRVALAEALWREGRRLEAVEVCLEILEALPNSLKANLILGEIWTQGGNEEAGEEKLEVARSLDPENRIAQEMMGSESPLPLEEILIPELESVTDRFEPVGPAEVAMAAAAGQLLDEEAEELAEEIPLAETAEALAPEEELPDWLRDVGVAVEDEPALDLEADALALEAEPEDELAVEEMPEWLQEFVGEEAPAAAEELAEEAETDQAPEWLPEPEEAEDQDEAARPEAEVPVGAVGLGAGLAAGVMVAAGVMKEEDEDTEEFEELAAPVDDEVPDWLQELVEPEEPIEVEEVAPVPAEDLFEPGIPVVDAAEEAPLEGEVPASLQALVAAGLLDEADLDSAMADMSTDDLEAQRAEDVPDWLHDLIEAPEGEVPMDEALPAEEVVLPIVGLPEEDEPFPAEEVMLPIVGLPEEDEPFVEEVVDLPIVEPPVAEVPPVEEVVDLPVVEAPVAEVPPVEEVVDLPVVEAPVAEVPPVEEVTDLPVVEEVVDLPVIEAPVAEVPSVAEVPPVPEVELPVIEEPVEEVLPLAEVELPVIEEVVPEVPPVAEVELPVIEDLVAEVPPVEEVELPVIEEPEVEAPAVEEAAPPVVEEAAPPVVEAVEFSVIEEPEVEAPPVEEGEPPVVEPVEPPAIEEPVAEALPVEEAAPPVLEELVEEAPPVTEIAEGPSRVDELESQLGARPRDYGARLELARLHRDEQDWSAALAQYGKLVSARKLLPEVRGDLEVMVEQDVASAQVYQLLGDIDMQQDQLDSALEMYRLARQSLTKR
ncbi:MAG: tetratricopeptide repeat protein [Anaerolineae bacterium]|jgi:tetratricopeptide (TPR) repeat protein